MMEFLILFVVCVVWARCELTAIENHLPLPLLLWVGEIDRGAALERLGDLEREWGCALYEYRGGEVGYWEMVSSQGEMVERVMGTLGRLIELDGEVESWVWIWIDGDPVGGGCGLFECVVRREPCPSRRRIRGELVGIMREKQREALYQLRWAHQEEEWENTVLVGAW
jgi:hypothetical protein